MQKNTKPHKEYEGPFTKGKRTPKKKEYIIEGRNTKLWSCDILGNMFNYMSEWHKCRGYASLKQAETALAALNKKGHGWEYRLREF